MEKLQVDAEKSCYVALWIIKIQ